MDRLSSSRSVLWFQVIALAGVQGAITLTWVIYNIYLADLLIEVGLTAEFAATILIVENAIAAICEPIMGGLSETQNRWMGSGLPFISLGVILASAFFIAIPVIVIWGDTSPITKWIFPIILVAWTTAMTIFRSPALSLLRQYSKPSSLPQAASIVTFMGGFIGAWRPIASNFLLSLGPALAFTIGSVVLLGATGILRFFHPPLSPQTEEQETQPPTNPLSIPIFGLLWIVGTMMAWATRFLYGTLPRVIAIELPQIPTSQFMFGLAIAMALTTLLAGQIGTKLGNQKAMAIGIVGIIFCLPLLGSSPAIAIFATAIVGIAIAYPLIWNGVVPLALSVVPSHRSGLGIGCFFGGFTGGMTLFSLMVAPHQGNLTPLATALGGAMSVGAIGGLMLLLYRIKNAGISSADLQD